MYNRRSHNRTQTEKSAEVNSDPWDYPTIASIIDHLENVTSPTHPPTHPKQLLYSVRLCMSMTAIVAPGTPQLPPINMNKRF